MVKNDRIEKIVALTWSPWTPLWKRLCTSLLFLLFFSFRRAVSAAALAVLCVASCAFQEVLIFPTAVQNFIPLPGTTERPNCCWKPENYSGKIAATFLPGLTQKYLSRSAAGSSQILLHRACVRSENEQGKVGPLKIVSSTINIFLDDTEILTKILTRINVLEAHWKWLLILLQ